MASKVSFKITQSSKFAAPDVIHTQDNEDLFIPPYNTGQIMFIEDLGQIWLDFHNRRRQYSFTVDNNSGGINYVGISTTDPKGGTVTIDGSVYSPKVNDMVVYKSKEYMWRKDKDGNLKWHEIGDEESPSWGED